MKNRTDQTAEKYFERTPRRARTILWTADGEGIVTLKIENTGWANRIAQKLLGRPKVSFIHLDKMGSFIWPLLDGDKNISELSKIIDERFGKEAQPLYERLTRYIQILDSYHFVEWTDENKIKDG